MPQAIGAAEVRAVNVEFLSHTPFAFARKHVITSFDRADNAVSRNATAN